MFFRKFRRRGHGVLQYPVKRKTAKAGKFHGVRRQYHLRRRAGETIPLHDGKGIQPVRIDDQAQPGLCQKIAQNFFIVFPTLRGAAPSHADSACPRPRKRPLQRSFVIKHTALLLRHGAEGALKKHGGNGIV